MLILLVLVLLITSLVPSSSSPSSCSSPPTSYYYKAAAVQYAALGSIDWPASRNLELNLQEYAMIAEKTQAEQENTVDVIVFPEAVLWGFAFSGANDSVMRKAMYHYAEDVPSASSIKIRFSGVGAINPCIESAFSEDNYLQLRYGSCIARNNSLITLINMIDRKPCNMSESSDCPSDGNFLFNTDVVFDKDGSLIAVYHKSHIFGTSPVLDEPAIPDLVSFNTSIGVTFGLFICYDIQFLSPPAQLVELGVREFLFASAWFNSPPVFNAIELQQSWSRLYQVNLVAANRADSAWVSGGGIFSQGEPLVFHFDPNEFNVTRTLVAEVPCMDSNDSGRTRAILSPISPEADFATFSQSSSQTNEESPKIYTKNVNCSMSETDAQMGAIGACVLVDTSVARDSPKRLNLQTTSSSLTCTFEATVRYEDVISVKSNVTYILAATMADLAFPGTPDPLHLNACSFYACPSHKRDTNDVVVCDPVWEGDSATIFQDVKLSGTFPSSGIEVLPMLAVGQAQVIPLNYSTFDTQNWTISAANLPAPLWSISLYGLAN